jgi:hypothetical protein
VFFVIGVSYFLWKQEESRLIASANRIARFGMKSQKSMYT